MQTKFKGAGVLFTKRVYNCTRKVKYVSRRIAVLAAEARTAEIGTPLYTYRCRECKQWHMTRQRQ